MKKKRLTPFSGSLFRLALGMTGGAAVLALVFVAAERTMIFPLHKSTGSYDTASGSLSLGDQRFLEHATALNADQLQLTELALRQAIDQRVRDFALRMGAEQQRHHEELQQLTSERGTGRKVERGGTAELQRETPPHFDAAFLGQMIDAQAEAMELFERAATQCEDPALRAFAVKALPAFQAHHAQAKQLRKTVG